MFRIPLNEAASFRVKYRVELREFARRKKFSNSDLENFFYIFHKICGPKREKTITRDQFSEIIELIVKYDNDLLRNRVLWTLCGSLKLEVTPNIWIQSMEIFFSSSLNEKMKYCFRVYDTDENKEIRRELIQKFLHNCFIMENSQEKEDAMRDFIGRIFLVFRTHHPHKITFEEYQKGVKRIPLLLQFLGNCIPDTTKEQFFDLLLDKKII